MKENSFDEETYNNWLNDPDREMALTEDIKEQCTLLDGYMFSRENLPAGNLSPDPKSTEEIQNDLASMYPVDAAVITKYMLLHAFTTVTVEDGTIKWAIWRDMKPIQL